jgi:hypothetical protein
MTDAAMQDPPPPTRSERQALSATLTDGVVGAAFAVLDGAAWPDVLPGLERRDAPAACLSAAWDRAMRGASPWLVPLNLPAEDAISDWALEVLLTGPNGLIVDAVAGTGLDALANRLHRLTVVERPNAAGPATFRFQDPRVFRTLAPTWDEDQLARFRGPIHHYAAVEPRTGQVHWFDPGDPPVGTRADPPVPREGQLVLRTDQLDMLDKAVR